MVSLTDVSFLKMFKYVDVSFCGIDANKYEQIVFSNHINMEEDVAIRKIDASNDNNIYAMYMLTILYETGKNI